MNFTKGRDPYLGELVMIRRRKFGIAGLSALALATTNGFTLAQDGTSMKPTSAPHAKHDEMRPCAEACAACSRECESCATHCVHLLYEGKEEHLKTFETCRDCATVCAAAAQIVARGGPFAGEICQACAKVCAGCAEACEQFPDDEHMKKCAQECRKCEKECREMVSHAGRAKA